MLHLRLASVPAFTDQCTSCLCNRGHEYRGHEYRGHEYDNCRKGSCIDRVRPYVLNTVGNAETSVMFRSICVLAQIETQKWLGTISTAILE